jgi:hypothetical protein
MQHCAEFDSHKSSFIAWNWQPANLQPATSVQFPFGKLSSPRSPQPTSYQPLATFPNPAPNPELLSPVYLPRLPTVSVHL